MDWDSVLDCRNRQMFLCLWWYMIKKEKKFWLASNNVKIWYVVNRILGLIENIVYDVSVFNCYWSINYWSIPFGFKILLNINILFGFKTLLDIRNSKILDNWNN